MMRTSQGKSLKTKRLDQSGKRFCNQVHIGLSFIRQSNLIQNGEY